MGDAENRLRTLARTEAGPAMRRSSALDAKTDALVCVAALVAVHGPPASYGCAIRRALEAGATVEEVVDTLVAVSATVGLARVVSATPCVAWALGFDIDSELEGIEGPSRRCE